jgi:hypothetical protein
MRLTFDGGLQTDPSVAPDGQSVAHSSNKRGNFDLYTQRVRGGNPVPVTDHAAHDWQPHWSVRDQLVFRSERDGGGLYVVAPTAGHETRVAGFGYQPQWSPDGRQILFSRSAFATMLYTVSVDGEPPRECTACSDRALAERAPHGSGAFGWFRDARHVSTLLSEAAPQYRPHLRIVDLENGTVDEWTVAPNVMGPFRTCAFSSPPGRWPGRRMLAPSISSAGRGKSLPSGKSTSFPTSAPSPAARTGSPRWRRERAASRLREPVVRLRSGRQPSNRKSISRIVVVGSKDGLWNDPVEERDWRYIDEELARKDKPRWSVDGRHIYFTSERGGFLNVWAADFNPGTGAIGTAFRVTDFDGPGAQMPTDMYWLENRRCPWRAGHSHASSDGRDLAAASTAVRSEHVARLQRVRAGCKRTLTL